MSPAAEQARDGRLADLRGREASQLRPELAELRTRIDDALAAYDLRAATDALGEAVAAANRRLEATAPWLLAARERASGRSEPAVDRVLTEVISYCRGLADELAIFVPSGAARLHTQLGNGNRIGPQTYPAFPTPTKTSSSREL
jgi:methionyl-tRNA synthetase